MILGFKKYFPWGERTWFKEKIIAGTVRKLLPTAVAYGDEICKLTYPKIHTMRSDPHNRWKAGMSIQMVYRGPKYSIFDHFNKGIPELEKCKGIQKVEIKWYTFHAKPLAAMGLKGGSHREAVVIIDGEQYPSGCSQVQDLARNDGFTSLEQFYKWFNTDWEGKIIHWTDFKY